jgi:signal transduction histidine kinase
MSDFVNLPQMLIELFAKNLLRFLLWGPGVERKALFSKAVGPFILMLLITPGALAMSNNHRTVADELPSITRISAFRDSSQQLNFENFTDEGYGKRFTPVDENLRVGHDSAAWWFHIQLRVPEHRMGQPLHLVLMPADLDEVTFYSKDGSRQQSGIGRPFSARGVTSLFPLLTLTPGQRELEIWVRVVNSGPMSLHFSLLSEPELRKRIQSFHFIFGLYFGALIIALIMSLMNWVWLGDGLYGRYALFACISAATTLTTQGYTSEFLLPEHPSWVVMLDNALISLLSAMAIFFSGALLNLKSNFPRIASGWHFAAWASLLSSGLALTPWGYLGVDAALWAFLLCGAGTSMISLYAYLKDRRPLDLAIFLGYFSFFLLQGTTALMTLGQVEATPWTMNSWLAGNIVLLICMLCVLIYRTRSLQLAKFHSEMETIKARAEADEAKRIASELRLFVDMITHELGSPLAVIDSSIQSIISLAPNMGNQVGFWLDNIRGSVRRLTNLTRDSLAKDRIDASGWEMIQSTLTPLDLANLGLSDFDLEVTTPGEFLFPFQVGGEPGSLRVSVCPAEVRMIGDLFLLHILIANLIDNASKYAIPASTIELKIICNPAEEHVVRLRVVNRCDFIPPDTLPRLFEKYYRFGGQGNIEGAGLGLFLVAQFARINKGIVRASMEEIGTICFEVELPAFISDHD